MYDSDTTERKFISVTIFYILSNLRIFLEPASDSLNFIENISSDI